MSKIVWDAIGDHIFETGVRNGVLYLKGAEGTYNTGVAWNGLTSVSENPEGAEPTDLYADDIKYLSLMSAENFKATIEAYTYPAEFEECDGSATIAKGVVIGQQSRKPFGLCYRTSIGNDTDGNEHGYKLHIVYGCQASPSEKQYSTINDSPDAVTFSWEVSTTPVDVPGKKPAATLTIDSTKADKTKLTALEAILYGSDQDEPRLPLPDEIVTLMGTV